MREFIVLGGAHDPTGRNPSIGGSAYLLIYDNAGLMIDCGIYPQSEKMRQEYSKTILQEISALQFEDLGSIRLPILPKACFLSGDELIPTHLENILPRLEWLINLEKLYIVATHAHTDHIGAIPYIKRRFPSAKIFMTEATRDISLWSWFDHQRIMKHKRRSPLFTTRDITDVAENARIITPGTKTEAGPFELNFVNSGHILGGVSVFAKMPGNTAGDKPTSFFFTSDICFHKQATVAPAPLLAGQELEGVDYLVTESTYGGKVSESRQDAVARLIANTENCLANGGKVLLPALSIGRAEEVISILVESGLTRRYPVWIDGSAKSIANIYIKNKALNPSIKELFVTDSYERRCIAASKSPCVMVVPAGMLIGGPAVYYAQRWINDERNLVGLTCYQEKFSPGARLLSMPQGQNISLNNEITVLRAQVRKYNLSAHATSHEIVEMAKRLAPAKNIFLVHGENEQMDTLCRELGPIAIKAVVNTPYVL